ncbi:MAG TPA: CDP-alcohol phosphatidyltransferase family protein [Gemmatimonadaceae bacterium]|jgi:CDP-diacylglycerol--glycerol-3-phosphate 3-phosphatidyltransferase
MNASRRTPVALTALRASLAPVMVLLALYFPNRFALGASLVAAFLSDIFDGIIARRLDVATPALRRLDSFADTLFYLCTAFAAWHLYSLVITPYLLALIILGVLEVTRYILDLTKFGREASYHTWSSKVWGIALFAGLFSLLALGSEGTAVAAAIYVGIIADVEGLVISIILTEWKNDVPTFVHALRLREAKPT